MLAGQTLADSSGIYVISLPRRYDRKRDMERLRRALNLKWSYVDALDADDSAISRIIERVRLERSKSRSYVEDSTEVKAPSLEYFHWPEDMDLNTLSRATINPSGADGWGSEHALPSQWPGTGPAPLLVDPLMCATENNTIPPYTPSAPPYKLLTPAKVACWHSHLSVIRNIANKPGNSTTLDEVYIILEDDVDMEYDIKERLWDMWPALPPHWDMLFLGHCWSNESLHPALPLPPYSAFSPLHPSNAPKCTHAYAVTKAGAARLLLHLRYPPFAYSRAIDQAYAWLIQSGRLRAFSVVPSIVIQRKVGQSDVWDEEHGGTGSEWRDTLVHGVLGTS
ncbi:hypothetical protein GLOTRDRAFT_124971 [Gloeophyllum trabeum ATCC 11539]|uniref:Glycosyltransferase family 25 protein n=1 Tax=Gloeophyllum trabeum (strain ATCC 11539 / FP-39264 / Madison 617) TaxID=670483 RepID=S7S5I3_GLOTA|nr:uncharacterized protein GLOTRDRAFT_124971 [Gloeophyllum trabeum ATCC 11539]EPQ61244.1 hypothetical protein GLOTRDRAFT_124971 [Gloeophyllum trabeum ATCC 11539]